MKIYIDKTHFKMMKLYLYLCNKFKKIINKNNVSLSYNYLNNSIELRDSDGLYNYSDISLEHKLIIDLFNKAIDDDEKEILKKKNSQEWRIYRYHKTQDKLENNNEDVTGSCQIYREKGSLLD